MNLKQFLQLTLTTAAASALLAAGLMADESASVLTIGSPAPSLDVEHWVSDGHGKFKPVTKFEPGKVYVVEFWATWCGPCIASMPHLAETQAKYADKGVQIVSISDEDLETVEGFLKRPVRGGGPSADDPEKKQTYAELTSAYCLTTDPDGSVQKDYMEAAGQNGIPTCFIVGKDARVEWIGHPMAMDEPLEAILTGSWNREEFLAEFKKEQERGMLMSKLSGFMRKGDTKGALALLARAKESAEGDGAYLAQIGQLEFQVKASTALQKIQKGDVAEGLKELDEVDATATESQKSQLRMVRFQVLVSVKEYDAATKALSDVVGSGDATPQLINQLTWQVYEAAVADEGFSQSLLQASASAAEAAVKQEPQNPMILDTLAHLQHRLGHLDDAIATQLKAIENVDNAPDAAAGEMEEFLAKLKAEKTKTAE
ncbi:MAG: redoxin family protein [Planctomycetaceae bacterium]|nr:redoxin family protein [Planctomycetaceae bacterium]